MSISAMVRTLALPAVILSACQSHYTSHGYAGPFSPLPPTIQEADTRLGAPTCILDMPGLTGLNRARNVSKCHIYLSQKIAHGGISRPKACQIRALALYFDEAGRLIHAETINKKDKISFSPWRRTTLLRNAKKYPILFRIFGPVTGSPEKNTP